jgi:hypothetical protein
MRVATVSDGAVAKRMLLPIPFHDRRPAVLQKPQMEASHGLKSESFKPGRNGMKFAGASL